MALSEEGVEVGLWTADQSVLDSPLLQTAASKVLRLHGSLEESLRLFGAPDVLHDNGIWLAHNHRLAELASAGAIPRIVSTRGMLDPWPLNHKRLKKRLAWWLYQRRDLKRARCLHATSEAEANNVLSLKLGAPVSVIPNGVDVPEVDLQKTDLACSREGRDGVRTALFLGRLYPIKGLPMLVEAWRRVRPGGWVLRIAGPDEAGHRAELERIVSSHGLGDVILFSGPLEGREKTVAFFDADLFVLPTFSENFGIVVGEALAHGLPVLTTTGAPWPILPGHGCGWWVPTTIDGIAEGLQQATALDPATLRAMGAKGRCLVNSSEYDWKRIARRFVSLYEHVRSQ